MNKAINPANYFENGWLKHEYLWELRQQITLGSLYYADYRNSLAIDEHYVCNFFTSFWDSYCDELACRDNLMEEAERQWLVSDKTRSVDDIFNQLCLDRYDNEETLLDWYNCFDNNGPDSSPLPPNIVNVDIHWDFARSIQVIAADEDGAEAIVEDMMRNGEIPQSSFEPSDWELDTTYQP